MALCDNIQCPGHIRGLHLKFGILVLCSETWGSPCFTSVIIAAGLKLLQSGFIQLDLSTVNANTRKEICCILTQEINALGLQLWITQQR